MAASSSVDAAERPAAAIAAFDEAGQAVRLAFVSDGSPNAELDLMRSATLAASLWADRRDYSSRLESAYSHLAEGHADAAATRLYSHPASAPDWSGAYVGQLACRAVAGLLVGQSDLARELDVRLDIDPCTRLEDFPTGIDETVVVTIISNLVSNAFDAVRGQRRQRRRVNVLVDDLGQCLRVRVSDQGCGMGNTPDDVVLRDGFSTKAGHSGLGLAIVSDLVHAAHGKLSIERAAPGTIVEVILPHE